MTDRPAHSTALLDDLSLPPCPLDVSRQKILDALAQGRNLVLSALPGAGKSSRVPLWLVNQPCKKTR